MASLTADLAVFAALGTAPEPIYMRANGADTWYRGGLCFFDTATADGLIYNVVTANTDEFAGVVAEHTVTTAANDFVRVYRSGIFLFANTAFTIANQGLLFHALLAGEDDPGALVTTNDVTTCGAIGRLVQVRTTAVDGYLDISDRFVPVNT